MAIEKHEQVFEPSESSVVEELRAKIRELTAELEAEKSCHPKGVNPADLAQGTDEMGLNCHVEFHWQETPLEERERSRNRPSGRLTVVVTWNEVFSRLGPELRKEATERTLRQELSTLCRFRTNTNMRNGSITTKSIHDLVEHGKAITGNSTQRTVRDLSVQIVFEDSLQDVIFTLRGLGLIEPGAVTVEAGDTNAYWKLTAKGEQSLINLRAIRRTPAEPTEEPEAAPAV